MKTVDQICDEFEKQLKEIGATAYLYSVSDPDALEHRWGTGTNTVWSLGMLEILNIKVHGDFVEANRPEDEEDKGF